MQKQNQKIINKNQIGNLYINCTTKNTLFTLTNNKQETIYQISSRSSKIKDLKKNSPYVVQNVSTELSKIIIKSGIKYLKCYIKGLGLGRYNFLKSLQKRKIKILYIKDRTPLPFNGCRPKKVKRR